MVLGVKISPPSSRNDVNEKNLMVLGYLELKFHLHLLVVMWRRWTVSPFYKFLWWTSRSSLDDATTVLRTRVPKNNSNFDHVVCRSYVLGSFDVGTPGINHSVGIEGELRGHYQMRLKTEQVLVFKCFKIHFWSFCKNVWPWPMTGRYFSLS